MGWRRLLWTGRVLPVAPDLLQPDRRGDAGAGVRGRGPGLGLETGAAALERSAAGGALGLAAGLGGPAHGRARLADGPGRGGLRASRATGIRRERGSIDSAPRDGPRQLKRAGPIPCLGGEETAERRRADRPRRRGAPLPASGVGDDRRTGRGDSAGGSSAGGVRADPAAVVSRPLGVQPGGGDDRQLGSPPGGGAADSFCLWPARSAGAGELLGEPVLYRFSALLLFALPGAVGVCSGGGCGLEGAQAGGGLWAWGSIGVGVFFALGRFNPVAAWLLSLVGGGALRYPVKFWLPVAAGLALLGGLGFEALREPRGRRRFGFVTALMGGCSFLPGLCWLCGPTSPGPGFAAWSPAGLSDGFVASERLRLAVLCLVSLVLVGALAVAVRVGRRWPVVGAALLVGLHAGSQLWLMRPLRPTDAVVPYGVPPPALDFVPAAAAVVNGCVTAAVRQLGPQLGPVSLSPLALAGAAGVL